MKASRPNRHERGNFRQLLPMTTRWRDNDAYGHLNNAVYNEYFDSALNQVLIGSGFLDIERSQVIGLVVQNFVPLYSIGWLDTYRVQIIPFIANAFSIFLFAHPQMPVTVALTMCCIYGVIGGSIPGDDFYCVLG